MMYDQGMVKVPRNVYNDQYCGGPGGVFNMFSITPVSRYKDFQFLSFNRDVSWSDSPVDIGDPLGIYREKQLNPIGWFAASSFDPKKSAFVYNRRLGRLIIPCVEFVLKRQTSPNFFELWADTFISVNIEKNWDEDILNDNLNSMYFGCGALNGPPYGYSYKLVFPSNPTGGSQNMSRGEKYDDVFQLGISQGFDDPRAEMYLKYVISNGQGSPINTNQDLYTSNCQTTPGVWSNFQYKMNSPLVGYFEGNNCWYLSVNHLDWQTNENDSSKGLDNLKTFIGKYPALFQYSPNSMLSSSKKSITHSLLTKQGWAHRNGKCLKVSDCLSGECSQSEQECKNKNKCSCIKSMERYSNDQYNYKILWMIIIIVVLLTVRYFIRTGSKR